MPTAARELRTPEQISSEAVTHLALYTEDIDCQQSIAWYYRDAEIAPSRYVKLNDPLRQAARRH